MVNRAQLAASLAALFWHYQLAAFWQCHYDGPLGIFRQRYLAGTKVIKEPQVSHTKITTTRIAGGLLLGYNPNYTCPGLKSFALHFVQVTIAI